MHGSGVFISLEGIDGCGKSSIISYLNSCLPAAEVVNIREPGGTIISESIRNMLLNDERSQDMAAETEALLYAAARSQVVKQVIKPALSQGKLVLADRFIDSTIAYQGFGRSLSIPFLKDMNDFCTGGLRPDLTILLDLEPEQSYGYKKAGVPDRIEREGLAFQRKVREGYLQLAADEPNRIVTVDAARDFSAVSQSVWGHVHRLMYEYRRKI
jgi:dTMP kinase